MGGLERYKEYYQRQVKEISEAKKEDLIKALGPDIYRELSEAYQKDLRSLLDKIPELLKWTESRLATRYLSIYEIFRHREGRCEEWTHFALGVLYLFDVKAEYVISLADHIWLIVQGQHYDPSIDHDLSIVKDRYNKNAYRNWDVPFSFMLAFDLEGNVRDVAADYIDMTPAVMDRRQKILDAE